MARPLLYIFTRAENMNKNHNTFCSIAAAAVIGVCGTLFADGDDETVMRPSIPGTNYPDYSKPALVKKGNTIYRTVPGTTARDYTKPAYVTEGNTTYRTIPGTSYRDNTKPAYRVSEQRDYPAEREDIEEVMEQWEEDAAEDGTTDELEDGE